MQRSEEREKIRKWIVYFVDNNLASNAQTIALALEQQNQQCKQTLFVDLMTKGPRQMHQSPIHFIGNYVYDLEYQWQSRMHCIRIHLYQKLSRTSYADPNYWAIISPSNPVHESLQPQHEHMYINDIQCFRKHYLQSHSQYGFYTIQSSLWYGLDSDVHFNSTLSQLEHDSITSSFYCVRI